MHDFSAWLAATASAGGGVVALVHCFGGVNRSSSAVLCLNMALEGLSLEDALQASVFCYKPRLCSWRRRDYFLPALLLLSMYIETL